MRCYFCVKAGLAPQHGSTFVSPIFEKFRTMKKAILSGVFVLGAALAMVAQQKEIFNGPAIQVDKEVHDYGTIQKNADGACEFIVTNVGTEPLVIEKCKGSCGCTVPTCPKEPIQPGGEGEIKVVFNSRGKKNKQTKRVTITANTAPEAQTVLTISANVTPAPEQGQ